MRIPKWELHETIHIVFMRYGMNFNSAMAQLQSLLIVC